MTTIAWDGKTLAGDRGTWHGYQCSTGRKVYRLRDPMGQPFLIGFAGDAGLAMAVLAWLRGEGPKPEVPKEALGKEDLAIGIDYRGRAFRLTAHLTAYRVYGRLHTFGGGGELAMLAMLAGADAVAAVRIVARVGNLSARGVDKLSFR